MCNNFTLSPSIGVSEKEFKEKIGQEKFDEIYSALFVKSNNLCFGCGFIPADKSLLQPHVEKWDGKDYKTAELVLLCEACHTIKHFDVAIKNDWVRLCNSQYSQAELVQRCRKDELRGDIANNRVIILNKTPQSLLEDLSNVEIDRKRNEKLKIVFGKKFLWNK